MHARRKRGRGVEKFDGAGKIEVGIRRAQSRNAQRPGIARDKNGRRAGRFNERTIFSVGEKREITRLGFFQSRDARNFGSGIAFEFAAQFGGDVAQFHDALL